MKFKWYEDNIVVQPGQYEFYTTLDFNPDSVTVFVNGLKQLAGTDYVLTPILRKITFLTNNYPPTGSIVTIRYLS
ncbi:MAG: hypothetical protein QXP66_00835 [Candidatus Aenigmatarchaeota archaeon]